MAGSGDLMALLTEDYDQVADHTPMTYSLKAYVSGSHLSNKLNLQDEDVDAEQSLRLKETLQKAVQGGQNVTAQGLQNSLHHLKDKPNIFMQHKSQAPWRSRLQRYHVADTCGRQIAQFG